MKIEGDNSSGVASVVLGILSISSLLLTFFAFLAPIVSLSLAICSFFFARNQAKIAANKWSKAGYLLSIIGIILGAILSFFVVKALLGIVTSYSELCKAAGGCDNIMSYLQSQQIAAAGGVA